MAKKSTLLDKTPLNNELEMTDAFAALHRWGFISRTQLPALMNATRSYLPCAATVTMRTRKGMAYVTLSTGQTFTIDTRAKVALLDMLDAES